jgi:hypothetical protein
VKKIWNFIKLLYRDLFQKSKAAIDKYVEPSILVVEKIKKFVESENLKFVLDLIPGNFDNETAAKINIYLPQILMYLRLANECSNLSTNDEVVQCSIEALKKADKNGKHAFYLAIASMLSTYLSDGRLQWSEAVILAQYTYEEKIKKS